MRREVGKAFRLLADDEDCRAIVLSGAGKMFTSGIDLSEFTSSEFDDLRSDGDVAKRGKPVIAYIRDWQSCITDLERCREAIYKILISSIATRCLKCCGSGAVPNEVHE